MESRTELTIDFRDVSKQVKDEIKSCLETSHDSIFSEEFKLPPSKSGIRIPMVAVAWHTLASKMVSTYWEKVGDTSPTDLLESAL